MNTTPDCAAELLRHAAALLEATREPNIEQLRWGDGWAERPYHVRFDFPGVVSVYPKNSGELEARTTPGGLAESEGADSRPSLLQAAVALIRSRRPRRMLTMVHGHGPGGNAAQYLVRFDFPGVVSVYVKATGQLVVRSKPGRPSEPDDGATP